MKRVFFVIILVLLFPSSGQPNFHGITDVSISPSEFSAMSNVTLSIKFTDASNVSSVRVTYCRILPEYLCYFPSYRMSNSTDYPNSFNTTVELKEEDKDGFTIGFRILVLYQNSTSIDFPVDNSPTFGFDILEPEEGLFYFAFVIGEKQSSEVSSAPTNLSDTLPSQTNTEEAFFPLLFFTVSIYLLITIKRKKQFL